MRNLPHSGPVIKFYPVMSRAEFDSLAIKVKLASTRKFECTGQTGFTLHVGGGNNFKAEGWVGLTRWAACCALCVFTVGSGRLCTHKKKWGQSKRGWSDEQLENKQLRGGDEARRKRFKNSKPIKSACVFFFFPPSCPH